MKRFALVRGKLRREGQLISDSDILIAATALEHDLILFTYNIAILTVFPTSNCIQTEHFSE
jgi:predicted nucleic acid-binding protein